MIAKAIKRIIQEIEAAPDLLQGLDAVVACLQEELGSDASSIFLCDNEKGEYVLMATDGHDREQVGKARLKFGKGLLGQVGEREEVINIDNATEHPEFFTFSKIKETPLQGFLGVPLIHQGELLGVLVEQRREEHVFSAEEEAFLVTLSSQLASAISQALAKGALVELEQKQKRRRKKSETLLEGVPGAPGIAIGRGVVVYPPADLDAVPDREAGDVDAEIAAFETALGLVREDIHELQLKAKSSLSVTENVLFDVYLRMLDSRTLMSEVETEIREGQWAQGALRRVIKQHVMHFESLDDPYLQERASDFRDLGRRILSKLQSNKRQKIEYPKDTILVSDEVTATMLMEVPEDCLRGVISGLGSSNSHVAILARALGLPTVMGLTGTPLNHLLNQEMVVDGYNGQVFLSPSQNVKKEFRQLAEEEQELDEQLEDLRDLPAETQDGHVMKLFINTGLAIDGNLSLSSGAEGVGLYRTEMPFMLRDRFPTEEEQRIMYRQLLNTFSPRPVVMRTLDIGGDKALSYFPVEEENPFLGWRGVRITLDHPEIFLQQVRAMLHANAELNNLSVMLPMVSSIKEVDESTRLIKQAHEELLAEDIKIKMPKMGLMIEVPAAVYQAYELARRVDFISVGSNDLIQYLLAVDRNNPRVADLYNGLHPAVLRALNDVVKAGHRARRSVSICGEMASDPVAVVLLLGMGYDMLSMSARALPRIKWVVRQFTMDRAKALVKEVLKMDDPREVRAHMEIALEEVGLGGLIRAGR